MHISKNQLILLIWGFERWVRCRDDGILMAQPHNIGPPFPPNFTSRQLTNIKGKHLKGFHVYRIRMLVNAQNIKYLILLAITGL
ncbi:hypothetical protein Glove_187g109 [Diversispora epigaea]|uniref:Uncharacterized protein n=1 Tax=Diversispora epigaea TaxID=1348612 RepID=A0A397IM14_9GLOM|nr:hypothetical protein Glove_187g109 [Diversispora epigaea]